MREFRDYTENIIKSSDLPEAKKICSVNHKKMIKHYKLLIYAIKLIWYDIHNHIIKIMCEKTHWVHNQHNFKQLNVI